MKEKKQCEEMMFANWRSYQCSNNAKMEHEGKYYCGTHDPVKRKARQDARYKKYDEEWAASKKKNLLNAAAPDLYKACKRAAWLYDELALSPLAAAAKYGDTYIPPSDEDCLEIREELKAAIAKADGEEEK